MNTRRPFLFSWPFALVAWAVSSAAYAGAPASTGVQPAQFRIAGVHVVGMSHYRPEDVIRLSGLQIGKPIALTDLTTSANALAATGMFDSVKYSYTTQSGQINVTFEIVEATRRLPAIFDNFVWFSDDEVAAALARDVPGFDGSVPVNAGAGDFVAHALQQLLATRNVAGHVAVTTHLDVRTNRSRYVFTVTDPAPKVCALSISGASPAIERELMAQLSGVPGGDFSREFLTAVQNGTLTDIYRRLGRWRAAFAAPTVVTNRCAGTSVQLNVSEGDVYTWYGASWTGATTLTTDALDSVLGFKTGDLADASKLETGLRGVHAQYAAVGHIMQDSRYEPRLDDAAHRATFVITVDEGPQFLMGTLAFPGLTEKDASMLTKTFRLKPGDVYDETYVKKYEREQLGPLRTRTGGRATLQVKADPDRKIVDLIVSFR